jgi:hypothetical protein
LPSDDTRTRCRPQAPRCPRRQRLRPASQFAGSTRVGWRLAPLPRELGPTTTT